MPFLLLLCSTSFGYINNMHICFLRISSSFYYARDVSSFIKISGYIHTKYKGYIGKHTQTHTYTRRPTRKTCTQPHYTVNMSRYTCSVSSYCVRNCPGYVSERYNRWTQIEMETEGERKRNRSCAEHRAIRSVMDNINNQWLHIVSTVGIPCRWYGSYIQFYYTHQNWPHVMNIPNRIECYYIHHKYRITAIITLPVMVKGNLGN